MSYELAKRALDLVGSGVGLAMASPVLAAVAVGIRATLGPPVLFRQVRPGLHGQPFELIKFRTMRTLRAGEDMLRSDRDRLTRLGRFLRRSSLDELPSLLNVLKGDMSLVGPRPLLMQYLARYNARQARRHEVRPGLTGWAQVHGRNALSWEEKLELDVWYVENRSLALDLKIIAMTVMSVVKQEGIAAQGEATAPEFMGSFR